MTVIDYPTVLAERFGPVREIHQVQAPWPRPTPCPADEHPGSYRGWLRGGKTCTCPHTMAVVAHRRALKRDSARARAARNGGWTPRATAQRNWRPRRPKDLPKNVMWVDLTLADTLDAEALLLRGAAVPESRHTQALAVQMIRQRQPHLSGRQVADRLGLNERMVWRMLAGLRHYHERASR